MKSLFKRTLATATGSVLALSQLAAVAVNISAADADALVVDKAWALSVPLTESEANSKALEAYLDAWTEETTDTVALESNWNRAFENQVAVAVGDGTVSREAAAAKAKTALRRAMLKTAYMDSASADKILAAVSDTAAVEMDDQGLTVTLTLDEVGEVVGDLFTEALEKNGVALADDNGDAFTVDWSGYSVKGEVVVQAYFDYSKTITYDIRFIDETGKSYQMDELASYAQAKFNEAGQVVVAAAQAKAAEYGVTIDDFSANFEETGADLLAKIDTAVDVAKAINNATASGTSIDDAYNAYLAAVKAELNSTVSAGLADRVYNAVVKRTGTSAEAALDANMAVKGFDYVIDVAQSVLGESTQIDLSIADVKSVLNEGYDFDINIPNGYSAEIAFSIANDQADELYAIVEAALAEQLAAENKEIIEVVSHKEVTLNVLNDISESSGSAYYNVVLVLDKIIVDEIDETTTTTTTTTENTDDTSTTTTTEATGEESGDTSTTTTEATGEGSDDTSTTTTTEATGEGSDDTSTTTTTGTEPAEVVYSVELKAEGLDENLIYWSEETAAFDLSKLVGTLTVYADGEVADVFDVTGALGLAAANPSEIDFTGFGVYSNAIVIKDINAIYDVYTAKGYAVSLLTEAGIVADAEVDSVDVTLVLRGDADLNGVVHAFDAQTVLMYYTYCSVMERTASQAVAGGALCFQYDNDEAYLKYAHYAADAYIADGILHSFDAQAILAYYTSIYVLGREDVMGNWAHPAVNADTTPQDILHSDPLANDTHAQ